jgi:hypothetical protein
MTIDQQKERKTHRFGILSNKNDRLTREQVNSHRDIDKRSRVCIVKRQLTDDQLVEYLAVFKYDRVTRRITNESIDENRSDLPPAILRKSRPDAL